MGPVERASDRGLYKIIPWPRAKVCCLTIIAVHVQPP
jgi:hypothetical protein